MKPEVVHFQSGRGVAVVAAGGVALIDAPAMSPLVRSIQAGLRAERPQTALSAGLSLFAAHELPAFGVVLWQVDGVRAAVHGNISMGPIADWTLDSGGDTAPLPWRFAGTQADACIVLELSDGSPAGPCDFECAGGCVPARRLELRAARGPVEGRSATLARSSSRRDRVGALLLPPPAAGSFEVVVPVGAPVAASAAAPPPGQHDGQTQARLPRRAPAVVEAPASPRASDTTGTQAVLCPSGHPNAPFSERCRACSAVITDRRVVVVQRPALGVLRFPGGIETHVTGPLVIGRNPPTDLKIGNAVCRAVVIDDGQISRHHATIAVSEWSVFVTDAGSTNGTVIVEPGKPQRALRPGESVQIGPGTTIDLGNDVVGRFEDT